jgi:hypothetical protein
MSFKNKKILMSEDINWLVLNLFSFIGKGIIACPPPKVWEILREPENSYRFNIMLKVS